MSYFLVAPGLDMSIELYVSERLERSVALQWERLKDSSEKEAFARRVGKQLETLLPDAIDWDFKDPTQPQLSYARAVSRELGIEIPADALRSRKVMHEFLETHVPQAKARWAEKSVPKDGGPSYGTNGEP